MENGRKVIAVAAMLVGLVAVALGVIYLSVKAHSLPSFLGKVRDYPGYRSKRGTAALIFGAVLVVGGAALLAYKPGSSGSARRKEPDDG